VLSRPFFQLLDEPPITECRAWQEFLILLQEARDPPHPHSLRLRQELQFIPAPLHRDLLAICW